MIINSEYRKSFLQIEYIQHYVERLPSIGISASFTLKNIITIKILMNYVE